MKTQTIKCIILGHKNLSDRDKLVFLYNEELGKIRTIAKGARKITSKFTGHLETLNFCTATIYNGPRNIILTEISTDKNYFRERKCANTITSAIQIAEITNSLLFENQRMEGLSQLLEKTIEHLKISEKKSLTLTAYIIKILDKVGTFPDLRQTKTSLEEKYVKFLNFIKEKELHEINQIVLTKNEKQKIFHLIQELIYRETGKKFTYHEQL